MRRSTHSIGSRSVLVAIALLAVACAPWQAQPTHTPSEASSPAPSPAVPSPTQRPDDGSLPTWDWIAADIAGIPAGGEIDSIRTLPGAAVAAWTFHSDDDGDTSTLFVSWDGLRWEPAPLPTDGFLVEHGTVLDGELTLITNTGPTEDPRRQIWTTRDGRVWTQLEGVEGIDFGPGQVTALVHSGAGWLANGTQRIDAETYQTHLFLSADRVSWTELDTPPGLGDVASDGRRTVAAVSRATNQFPVAEVVAWSEDARSWTTEKVAMLGQYESGDVIGATQRGFAIGGQRFEVEEESSHAIGWWSSDGVSWQESTFQVLDGPAGEAAPREMLGTVDVLSARGNGDPLANAVWVSEDGRAWRQVTPLPLGDISAFARDGDAILPAIQPGSGEGVIWRGTVAP